MKLTQARAKAVGIAATILGLWSLDVGVSHRSYLLIVVGVGSLAVAGWVTWQRRVEVKRWLKALVASI
jgi:hypothetical protein